MKKTSSHKTNCQICNNTDVFLFQDFAGATIFTGDGFAPINLKKWGCPKCNHIFSTNFTPRDLLQRHYATQNRIGHPTLTKASPIPHMYQHSLKMISRSIEEKKRKHKNIKMLDLGCGSGELMFFTKTRHPDVEVHGVDMNPAAKYLEQMIDVKVFDGAFPDVDLDNCKYDIVCLSGVIEHQENIIAFLKKVKPILKKDGEIIIIIPNSASILNSDGIIGDRIIYDIMTEQHYHNLSCNSIQLIAKKIKGTVIEIQEIRSGFWYLIHLRINFSGKKQAIASIDEPNITKLHDKYLATIKRLGKKIEKIVTDSDNLVIYGAGWHTCTVLPLLYKNIARHDFRIYDMDKRKHNTSLLNKKVMSPDIITSEKKSRSYLLSTVNDAQGMSNFLYSFNNFKATALYDIYAMNNTKS